MKTGEELTIGDGDGWLYLCVVESYEEDMAVLKILEKKKDESELPSKIYLFQGLPKQDKMELIVQKAVELGVYQVIPVATKRAVVKLDAKKAKKKVERWQQIAVSAAKQAGRGIIPAVGEVCTYAQALKYAEELDVVLIPYELAEGMEETKQIIAEIRPGQSVGIFIGPEGGFEKEEVEQESQPEECPIKEDILGDNKNKRESSFEKYTFKTELSDACLLYTSPSPRD